MEKPILFSTNMVQALLAGRKKMTRRTCKEKIKQSWVIGKKHHPDIDFAKCPYGQVGDILWVREKFAKRCTPDGEWNPKLGYCYCADNDPLYQNKKWKPSIHMPKDACRIFLQITKIRVERLKDITEEDAIAEGMERNFSNMFQEWRYKDYAKVKDDWRSPISSFQSLWATINGFNSWDENPWVWVVEFKRINKPSHV